MEEERESEEREEKKNKKFADVLKELLELRGEVALHREDRERREKEDHKADFQHVLSEMLSDRREANSRLDSQQKDMRLERQQANERHERQMERQDLLLAKILEQQQEFRHERREAQEELKQERLRAQERQDKQLQRQDVLVSKMLEQQEALSKLTSLVGQQKAELTTLQQQHHGEWLLSFVCLLSLLNLLRTTHSEANTHYLSHSP